MVLKRKLALQTVPPQRPETLAWSCVLSHLHVNSLAVAISRLRKRWGFCIGGLPCNCLAVSPRHQKATAGGCEFLSCKILQLMQQPYLTSVEGASAGLRIRGKRKSQQKTTWWRFPLHSPVFSHLPCSPSSFQRPVCNYIFHLPLCLFLSLSWSPLFVAL